MRAYAAANEEALHTSDLLRSWKSEGLLTEAQCQLMQQETNCDLRRTNVFLRIVLFFLTVILAGAGVILFLSVFFPNTHDSEVAGSFLLFAAFAFYAASEFAVTQFQLYRHGIEEALAVCSVACLCIASFAFDSHGTWGWPFLAGFLASLWIWLRFGLTYAFPGAMAFLWALAYDWTPSHSVRHLIVFGLYACGLLLLIFIRRRFRFSFLNQEYAICEAFLWLGLYLATNLQISSPDLYGNWGISVHNTAEFSKPFYWTTWVLIWCLPPLTLLRGLRNRDRAILLVGLAISILTRHQQALSRLATPHLGSHASGSAADCCRGFSSPLAFGRSGCHPPRLHRQAHRRQAHRRQEGELDQRPGQRLRFARAGRTESEHTSAAARFPLRRRRCWGRRSGFYVLTRQRSLGDSHNRRLKRI